MSHEYQDLADEYYDDVAHPTIALLRAGSMLALEALRAEFFRAGRLFAEVGSGRGMLHSVVELSAQVLSFDLNPGMLRYVPGLRVIADSAALPVPSNVFDGVFASLCDPYNTDEFLGEAKRVLRKGGRLLMTVPDYQWVRYNQDREGVVDAAVVVSRSGPVVVPSYVHAPAEQVARLHSHGFTRVHVHHTRLDIAAEATGITSRRLLNDAGLPISPNVTSAYLGVC